MHQHDAPPLVQQSRITGTVRVWQHALHESTHAGTGTLCLIREYRHGAHDRVVPALKVLVADLEYFCEKAIKAV